MLQILCCFWRALTNSFVTSADIDINGGMLFSCGKEAPMSDFPIVGASENVTRRVLSDHSELMVVAFRCAASGAPHAHPNVRSTYVASGRFRFDLGAETREDRPIDSVVIPSVQTRGCVCLGPGTLKDSSTPRRKEFL